MKSNIKQVLVATGIVLAAAAPVYASNFTFDSVGSDPGVTVTMTGGTPNISTAAGTYSATLNSQPITVFCVDPLDEIVDNQSYTANTAYSVVDQAGSLNNTTKYFNGGLASQLEVDYPTVTAQADQVRSAEIAYLANQFLNTSLTPSLKNSSVQTNGAADAQLAIWDIFISGGDIGAANDNFEIANASAGLITGIGADEAAALSFITANPTTTSLDEIAWIQAPQVTPYTQDFAYYTPTPPDGGNGIAVPGVPEPSLGAFLWSLCAAVGVMMFMKRRSSVIE